MNSQVLQQANLPDSPGVYFFKKGAEILYIGKATSLADRVRSYFGKDLPFTRGPLVVQMMAEADSIDFQKTDSVLEALLLEAHLIRKHKPRHNTKEKDDKSFNWVIVTKEAFPQVRVIRGRELEQEKAEGLKVKYAFGPFPHGMQLREAMKIIRRIFPFRDERCKPVSELPLERQKSPRPCFNRQIGLCPGVCTGEITKEEYGRQIEHLALLFEGRKSALMKSLEAEMKAYAKAQEFEKAISVRRKIDALGHIQDIALVKRDSLPAAQGGSAAIGFRIEAYDIAHISGTSVVGVMTVLEDGEPKKSDYRMFRVRGNSGNNDVAALREVLRRRFAHAEWPMPRLIVIDGGIAQKNAAEAVLAEIAPHAAIPVVSVVKDDRHKADHLLGDESLAAEHRSQIILANSEAHRFAVAYHRKVRGRLVR